MATCKEIVAQYRNLPGQHVQELWNQINKKSVKSGQLRDILMFYLHHKMFPPPLQKSFDTLLMTVPDKGTSKKMKNIMFHIMEEICPCLESSIVEAVCFSQNNCVVVELLNCIIVGGLVPLLDEIAIEKLFRLLQSPDISTEERGKLLCFLCQASGTYPAVLSRDHIASVCQQMSGWLHDTRSPPVATPQLFNRSDSSSGTEVDGTMAGELFTVLTLAQSFNESHMMGVHTFTMLREWLCHVSSEQHQYLLEVVREYCSMVVEQCFRPAQKEHDMALQKAILCEVLEILNKLVQLDRSQGPQSLLLVKRIQTNVMEKFKADHRDISIFVRVLRFLLNFGETTGYNSQLFCEKFFGDIIHCSYSSGLAAFDIIVFIVETQHMMAALQQPLLQRFFPNLLKLVACHPAALIEEFIELVPAFVSSHTAVEVFHSLVDLPVLSATLCLHQAPALLQLEHPSSFESQWMALLESARSATYRPVFSYMIRHESGQAYVLDKLPSYLDLLAELFSHPLVVTCSQIVPLLLEVFLTEVERQADARDLAALVLAILSRLRLLCNVSGYSTSVHRCLTQHFKTIFKLCPELVFIIQTEMMAYISVLNNSVVCQQLYTHLVWAAGEYTSQGYSEHFSHELVAQYYETVECILYETLAHITSQETVNLKLLNVTCSTLTKLASRCQDLIPRVLLCLSKVRSHVTLGLPTTAKQEKKIVFDRVEELMCLLRNPNIAAVILSSSHENDPTMSAVVRVLAQFTDG